MIPKDADRRGLRRVLRALKGPIGARPRPVHWDRAPEAGLCLPWLLPPALPGQPPVAVGWGGQAPCDDAALAAMVACPTGSIRTEAPEPLMQTRSREA